MLCQDAYGAASDNTKYIFRITTTTTTTVVAAAAAVAVVVVIIIIVWVLFILDSINRE